jgi:uncharacterized protein YycO
MKLKVRFSANNLPFSWAIRVRTWSPYSHVDFILPNGKYLGAVPFKGVVIHDHTYPVEAFFEVEVTEEQHEKILKYALDQVGKGYDYVGIFGYAIERNWQEDDKWFCSEFVAAAIQQVIPLFNEVPSKISPRDLAILSQFVKV